MTTPEEASAFIEFISNGGVDEKAASAFWELDEPLQQEVMMRGSFADGRNPSAILIGRIRDAKRKLGAAQAATVKLEGGLKRKFAEEQETVGDAIMDVEAFLVSEGIDDKAGQALRELDPELQQLVLSRGSVAGGRNPSAMLIGRVRDAKKTALDGAGKQLAENFILEQGVDAKAADALRELTPAQQADVMSRGALEGRNPSAMLLGRIRDTKSKQVRSSVTSTVRQLAIPEGGLQSRPGPKAAAMHAALNRIQAQQAAVFTPMPVRTLRATPKAKAARTNSSEDVESFILVSGVDEKAASALRELPSLLQQMVMSRGPLAGKNPSAMLIGRIRDAKSTGHVESIVEEFIQDQGIDEKAADSLRELAPELQEEVLSRGSVADGRNPSAVLIGRIRDVKKQFGQTGMSPMMSSLPAFGMMPQFHMIPMPMPMPMMGKGGKSNGLNEVERFIRESGVDAGAAQQLREAGRAIQQKVMQEGELVGRNPSAMLIGRLKKCR